MDLALLRAERMKRGITQEKLAKCLKRNTTKYF